MVTTFLNDKSTEKFKNVEWEDFFMVVKEFLPEDPEVQGVWRKIKSIIYASTAGLALAIGGYTSLYTVPADSMGVVQRFGKFARVAEPGIHMKWPYGIEEVGDVPVRRVQKEEFGFRTLRAGVDTQFLSVDEIEVGKIERNDLEKLIIDGEETVTQKISEIPKQAGKVLQNEYLMLTGDLNMADVEWIIQYTIKDPAAYKFNIREPRRTLRDLSQSVMRTIIGNGSVDEAITIGRIDYQNEAKVQLQKLLDLYDTGIHMVAVQLQSSNPPRRVRPAFNGVNESMQKKERRINEAVGDYNEAVPKAMGEAERIVKKAEGYAIERVNKAQGDVAKFDKMREEYLKAPEITRQRMYFEAIQDLLPGIPEKWIIEQKGAEGGILQKLDLNGREYGK